MRRRFTLSKHLAVLTIFLSVCSSVWPQTANHEAADNSLASILPDTVITNRPDGREVIYSESSHNIWQSNGTMGEDNIDHKMKQIVFGNDGYVYVRNFIVHLYGVEGWIKGKIDGDTLRFPLPQKYYTMGSSYSHRDYTLMAFDKVLVNAGGQMVYTYQTDTTCTEMDFVMRDDSIISTDPTKLIGLANATYYNAWSQFAMSNVTYTINKDTMAQMPENVTPETWTFEYMPNYGDRVTRMVSVATKGNELYIKGFSKKFPDAVIKGRVDGNKMVIPSRQLLALDKKDEYYAYLLTSSDTIVKEELYGEMIDVTKQKIRDSISFDYDAIDGTLVSADNLIDNHGTDSLFSYNLYKAVAFNYFDPVAATPAKPEWIDCWSYDTSSSLSFNIYSKDENDKFINPDSLYYVIYNDDQPITLKAADYDELDSDMTMIPYASDVAYVDGNYHGITLHNVNATRIGLQTVYVMGGETRRSPIVYYGETDGISATKSSEAVKTVYYDLSGREISNPSKGIYVKVVEHADGSRSTSKVTVK